MKYLAHGKWKICRWMHTNDIIVFRVKENAFGEIEYAFESPKNE